MTFLKAYQYRCILDQTHLLMSLLTHVKKYAKIYMTKNR